VLYGTTASITVTDDAAKAGQSSSAQTFYREWLSPANDNIANAIAGHDEQFHKYRRPIPRRQTENTDPTPPLRSHSPSPKHKSAHEDPCGGRSTAASSGIAHFTTIGSAYDTTLSVWTGTPGSLTNIRVQ